MPDFPLAFTLAFGLLELRPPPRGAGLLGLLGLLGVLGLLLPLLAEEVRPEDVPPEELLPAVFAAAAGAFVSAGGLDLESSLLSDFALDSEEEEEDESSDLDSSFSAPARLRLFSLSPLKSVSYQPLPLRRNTGADISFCMVFLPHDGHFSSGGSEIFCINSV